MNLHCLVSDPSWIGDNASLIVVPADPQIQVQCRGINGAAAPEGPPAVRGQTGGWVQRVREENGK